MKGRKISKTLFALREFLHNQERFIKIKLSLSQAQMKPSFKALLLSKILPRRANGNTITIPVR
jgi:hypothetical protein